VDGRTRSRNAEEAPAAGSVTIGEASRRSGFSIKTLRYYERRGLLAPSSRSAGGYRLFTEIDLGRLEFVRQAKALGLTLNEIQELMRATRERTCAMTRPLLLRVLDRRIADASRQIEALIGLRRSLQRSRRALFRRRPTDHRRGYCSCLGPDGSGGVIRDIRPKRSGDGTR